MRGNRLSNLLRLIPYAKRRLRCRQRGSILALRVLPLLYSNTRSEDDRLH